MRILPSLARLPTHCIHGKRAYGSMKNFQVSQLQVAQSEAPSLCAWAKCNNQSLRKHYLLINYLHFERAAFGHASWVSGQHNADSMFLEKSFIQIYSLTMALPFFCNSSPHKSELQPILGVHFQTPISRSIAFTPSLETHPYRPIRIATGNTALLGQRPWTYKAASICFRTTSICKT